MNRMIAWIAGFTKVGRAVKKLQELLDGKKQAIASLIVAVPATGTILIKFQEGGLKYLSELTTSPEFLAASGGWVAFFNAMKGEKIRTENAEIIEKLDKVIPSDQTLQTSPVASVGTASKP